MALNQAQFEADLLALYNDCTVAPGLTKEEFAARMAQLITDYIKTATVNTTVNTTVTGTLPTGPVAAFGAGTGVGSLT